MGKQLVCKFCWWKFHKRRDLKQHLISQHNLSHKRAKEIVDEGKWDKKPQAQTLGEIADF